MMENATLKKKSDAGNPHVRFDEGEVASAQPRRGSLLYSKTMLLSMFAVAVFGGADTAFSAEGSLFRLDSAETFAISAENPTGARGGGSDGPNRKPRSAIGIGAGQTAILADIDGPGCIEHIWVTGTLAKELVLRCYWDGQSVPSVEAPLTAFFGWGHADDLKTVDGKYPCLNSALLLAAPGMGLNSYFQMPFKKHAKITIENRGKAHADQYYMITGSRGPQPDDMGYFHAAYRQACPVERGKPYVVIDGIKGKGRFIGITLASSVKEDGCWVEGETRMFLDGEKLPSLQYTGIEDYFCGAYAFGYDNKLHKYQTYSGHYVGMCAFFGKPDFTPGEQQRFLLYRFHVKDPIRFSNGFRMTMDDMRGGTPRADDFRTVAYWYQTLPTAPFAPLPTF